ncbi:putative DMT(Drug/metabolite transporter) superfamily permease [Candidatus Terasakiella magnetica]|uniref:Putative DMT(Drug/metabolite transporter) superfamily permease n=1 Tax=Candidatus Terasakiella magnetica TaxID=1867952 RepID=A0A1C3RGX2_9PROT|nr:DMT family transporter [Candidatus Terasakiella magnetica]SCA56442.1 putative DMT(Drug/metabolite transporter) superfamily permease [Candidatus Terasakiella magnetica]
MSTLSPISRGLLIMALGIALMSVMDAMIKHLTDHLSAAQILFFRSLFGFIPLLYIIAKQGGIKSVHTKRPVLHLFRAVLGAIMFVGFTIGLREMSLANALAICFSAPFFMVGLSALLIGEKIGFHRICAVIAGFIGVMIVLQPDDGIFGGGAGYMMVVAVSYALTQVLARKYKESETALSYTFWTTLGMSLIGFTFSLFFWQELTFFNLLWCVAMGLFGTVAHYFMTEAARITSPIIVSPMEYTALIWAAVFDWTFWHVIPEQATVAGSLVIVASGIYILWRERTQSHESLSL